MMNFLSHALLGLAVGIVAKLLLPGRDPGGLIITCLLGVAGGFVGGYLGTMMGVSQGGRAKGFLMSVVGAIVLLLGYRAL